MSGAGADEVLGIDVGTTYTAAAVAGPNDVSMLSLGSDRAAVPTVVVVREDGEVLVGEAAERRAATQPDRTAREFKRRIGDPVPVVVGGTPYGAEALVAHVLRWVLAEATTRRGGPPSAVALSHPASWSTYKTDLLRHAAQQAGLPEVTLITEPQAAAVHYAQEARLDDGATVAVYDFGGGTFDAAVVRRVGEGWELLGVPEGLERFGGIDLDQAVLAHVDRSLDGMLSELDTSDPAVRSGLVRLREECRRAKEALSTDTDTVVPVVLPTLTTDVRLTRAELESMARPRIAETVTALERAVTSAGITPADLDRVLLVGGSSRMPLVAEMVHQALGVQVAADANPKLAIAYGAALAGRAAQAPSPAPAPPAPPAVPPPPVAEPAPVVPAAPVIPAPAPVAAPAPAPAPAPSSSGGPGKGVLIALGVVALLVFLGVGALAVTRGGGDGGDETADSPPTTEDDGGDADPIGLVDPADEPDPTTAAPTTAAPTTAAPTTAAPAGLPAERMTDASGALSAEVPTAWASRLTNPVDLNGVLALQISAATDQTGYGAFTAPGVTVLAGDAAEADTPAEILSLVAPAFTGTCQAQPSTSFSAGVMSGIAQRWTGCGGGVSTAFVNVGTSVDGVVYLVSGVALTPDDEAAYQRALESAVLSG